MSDSDELDSIRERKLKELEGRADAASDSGGPDEPVHVDGGDHLRELVDEHSVVLVDFYADWCGPCKMLEPTVEELARETDALVAKVDIDANQQLAAQYQVRGVPTLLLFADGQPVEQVVGVRDKGTLAGLIGQYAA